MPREQENNDIQQQATLLTLGEWTAGNLASPTDVDWYAFDLTGGAAVNLAPSTYGLEGMTVYDASGNVIVEGAHYTAFDITGPGRYYIKIEGGAGSFGGFDYSFVVFPASDYLSTPEPNGTPATAVTVALGTQDLILGQISSPGDEDWFRVNLPAGTGALSFNFNLGTYPVASSIDVMIDGVVQTLALQNGYGYIENVSGGSTVHFNVNADSFQQSSFTYIDYRYQVDFHGYRSHVTAPASSVAPTDPLFSQQWYLGAGAGGLDVLPVWADYTGEGITLAILSDGIDAAHADLDNNYTGADGFTLSGGSPVFGGDAYFHFDTVGTGLAGIAAAERNGSGIVGVAYNTELSSIRFFHGVHHASLPAALEIAADADVMLLPALSYGSFQYTDFLRDRLADASADGRGGLGTVIVGGAGDDAVEDPRDTNEQVLTNNRHIVTVAATDRAGLLTDYSRAGSSILVSAPGGTAADGLLTTDRVGSTGSAGDHAAQHGTLYAAAAVSGVVALMLEANPDLGWRDVQEILALSARATDPGHLGWQVNGATGWNGAGLYYSEFYGYGMVDARAAVRLAESWTDQQTSANETVVSADRAITLPIPDNNPTGVFTTLDLSALTVDRVEVTMRFAHTWMGDMVIDLISPSGTVANLMLVPGSGLLQQTNVTGFVFGSAAFLGEDAAGTWTLVLRDVQAQDTGTLFDWTIRAYGSAVSADDTYVYTDEFGALTDNLAARQVLSDTNGGHDVVNLAALSAGARIDLAGGSSQIAGRSLSIASGVIEDAYGGDGGDVLIGNGLANKLQGARGDDMLFGGAGDDTLLGGAGNDWLDGGAGNDLIDGGEGFDTVSFRSIGGSIAVRQLGGGVSEVTLADGSVVQVLNVEAFDAAGGASTTGSAGDDQFTGGEGDDMIALGAGNDYLAGSGGNDSLSGGDGQDWLWGGSGNDTLDGGAEKDNLNGEAGDDLIRGGAGNDRITGRDGNDTIHAGEGNDWVGVWNDWGEQPELNYFPEWGDDLIFGEGGDDVLSAGFGNDTVHGGIGNDYLAGEQDDDLLYGGEGQDWLWGGSGNDTLDGGAEKDNLNGEAGDNLIRAGDGNDRITGQAGNDTIHAGEGNDWVGVWNDWGEQPELNYFPEWGDDLIFGEGGDDVLSAGFGNDTVHGGIGNDYVAGEQGDDLLFGNEGVDWLWGGSGNDTMEGGEGDDVLIGEEGFDLLTGGAGADRFVYRSLSELGDTITDFDEAEGDVIDVSELLANIGYTGSDAWADQWLLQRQLGEDVLYELDRDGTGAAFDPVLIATVQGNTIESFNFGVFGTIAGMG